ncbi:hypothetical protein ABFS83_09G056400 [Erythranthe nasuta]
MDLTCHCGRKLTMKTSWTDLNPGRRYSTCEKYRQVGGCYYFAWIDPPMCERARQIIPSLLRRINKLEEDLKKKQEMKKWLWIGMFVSSLIVYCFL